jgi:predicted ribosome quality control (RQC) complex YloA/Tae2 family protein
MVDPSKRPKDQVDAIFARARRLKRGSGIAQARLDETREKLARLARLRAAVSAASSVEELVTETNAAHRDDPARLPGIARTPSRDGARTPKATAQRLPYRTFVTASGDRILVGRGAGDNDELTLHVARPYDLWLHAKAERGAHVVVPLTRGHEAPADLLVDAGHLAAHFSDARGESLVDVTYAPRRFVRKRRGSPAGRVQVDRPKNLALRVDAGRIAALLAREET